MIPVLISTAGWCDCDAPRVQVRGDLGAGGSRLCVHLRQGVHPRADPEHGEGHAQPAGLPPDRAHPVPVHVALLQGCQRRQAVPAPRLVHRRELAARLQHAEVPGFPPRRVGCVRGDEDSRQG